MVQWSGLIVWPKKLRIGKIDEARIRYPAMKEKYDKRKTELKEAKYQILLRKQNEKKDKEEKQSTKKINAVNAIVNNNWNASISCEQATEKLKQIPDKLKAEAILAQMDFYRYVIEVKCPIDLFYKTTVISESKKR